MNLSSDIQVYEMVLEQINATSITVTATIYDVDSTYVKLDKKRKALEMEINKTTNKITSLNSRKIDDMAKIEALRYNNRALQREINKLEREEEQIRFDWITKNKKHRRERIVIDKSVIDRILTKRE